MGKLTYEELILLDNLIYLEWNAEEDELLNNIVYNMLSDENFYNNIKATSECVITIQENEWINILEQIVNKPNLQKLRIRNINTYEKGVKAACFIDDKNNATVVFRGTATINEWEDNGVGAYEYETIEQINALNYINGLNYDNITVTGHSKGGNKAQYVTILSTKVDSCVAINAQGFSNEFMSKYKDEINNNKFKIISINAKYDYINCLFNSISGKVQYIQTEIQINPFYYHKANILLDSDGNLRKETDESIFSKIINNFSESIISNLPKDIKNMVTDKIIDIIELILCRKEKTNNILKSAGEILIMFCYEKFFDCPEIFHRSYPISEILILPLLFWRDFVNVEENDSKEILDDVIKKIDILGIGIIKKMEIIDRNQMELINQISQAIDNLINELTLEKNK